MRIIFLKSFFIKDYIDDQLYDADYANDAGCQINQGDNGMLLDDVTGKVVVSQGFAYPLQLEGVPSTYYVPERSDVD
jgi:hypothetical protein